MGALGQVNDAAVLCDLLGEHSAKVVHDGLPKQLFIGLGVSELRARALSSELAPPGLSLPADHGEQEADGIGLPIHEAVFF